MLTGSGAGSGQQWPRSMAVAHAPMVFFRPLHDWRTLPTYGAHLSQMARGGITESSFARVCIRCGERSGRAHDGGVLQRPFPPVLGDLCLGQSTQTWAGTPSL
jgi:hypothetical protein